MFTQWSGESEPCNAVLIEKQVKSTVRISLVTLSPVCNLNDEGGHSVTQSTIIAVVVVVMRSLVRIRSND